jgi:uncharacterized protein YndB with AHSA1/START domain
LTPGRSPNVSRYRWDPAGEPLQSCQIDLRVGGAVSFICRSRPDMPFVGTYREISAPTRIVFEALGATGRVLLSTSGEGTRMVVEIECAAADHFEQFMKMGVAAGTARTLDNLVRHLDPVRPTEAREPGLRP